MRNTNITPIPEISHNKYQYISPEGLKKQCQILDPSDPSKNTLWTTDYTVELPICLTRDGPGSELPFTLISGFINTMKNFPNQPALSVKRKDKVLTWTFKDYFNDSCLFAKALIFLGVTKCKSVNIIGFNAPEWSIAFFGSIFANNLPVGVYTTNGPDSCFYLADHSEAEVVVVENNEHLKKYLQIWDKLPNLKYIIMYNDKLPENIPEQRKRNVFLFKDFLELGKELIPKDQENSLEYRMRSQKPGNCCTMVYTSGTTGPPKAVMLSHDNYTWTAQSLVNFMKIQKGTDRMVSYLPLSHVAGQIVDIVLCLLQGINVYFADPSALQGSLVNTLVQVKPTLFFGVPRIWEKIEEKIKSQIEQSSPIKKYLFEKARQTGLEGTKSELIGEQTPFGFGLFKQLIYNNIKSKIGLDQARILTYGAAPLSLSTRQLFFSLNMFLVNVYGMSESSGPLTGYNTDRPKNGIDLKSAGAKFDGSDILISHPDSDNIGEICIRGRSRFMGYFKNESETRKTIDNKGYLHSGDLGRIDNNGVLFITGRIKELIITAGGENIAPINIENQVKDTIPIVNNVMLIGEQKKYLSALLTLKTVLNEQQFPTDQLTCDVIKIFQGFGSSAKTVREAQNCKKVMQYIQKGIDLANNLSTSRAHSIRKWVILDRDFTIAEEDLTPTLKLKRDVVQKKNANLIQQMYVEARL